MSIGQAVQQAVQLGYAEPGAQNPYEVIKSEAEGDIPKKISILFNRLGLDEELLSWESLQFELEEGDVAQAVEEAKIRRFIVSLYPTEGAIAKVEPENDIIGGFKVQHGNWLVVGGFRHTEKNPLFHPLANLTGPGNGFVIGLGPDETDGVYGLTGPGAGPRPTVNTMLDDYLSLC
jgi:homoserine dehydrogenase